MDERSYDSCKLQRKAVHSTYYLLYATDQLDSSSWESLQKTINCQLADLEAESLYHGYSKPAYAICILCNGAESAVTQYAHKVQFYQNTSAYICIGIVSKNEWHLSPRKDYGLSKLSRTLLGKGTFGLKSCTFPYKGNNEYTDEFYQKVEDLCNSHLKDR